MSTITTGTSGRLTTPLIRESQGHRPASWEEALDFVAGKLRRQIETRGPRSFGMFSCSKTTNELNYSARGAPPVPIRRWRNPISFFFGALTRERRIRFCFIIY
jgi:anaerobic selenocysteine-containing dehydrogenase